MANQALSFDRIKLCKDLKIARIRIGLMGLFHFLLPPVASLVYAIKTQYWTPFILATVVGIFTTLTSTIVATAIGGGDPDSAFITSFMISSILGLIPMSISFFMFQSRAMNIRARNNIIMPEQADRMFVEAISTPNVS